jgi:signal transduction histidine kinase
LAEDSREQDQTRAAALTRLDELERWRERAFRFVLLLTLAFSALPLVLWSLLKAEQGRFHVTLPIWAVYAAFIVLAVAQRIPWRFRAAVFLVGLLAGGATPMLEYGFHSQGPLLMLAATVASTVFLGLRAGVIWLLLSLGVVAASGVLFVSGTLTEKGEHPLTSLPTWLSFAGTLLFLGVSLVATVGVLMRRLEASLVTTRARVRDLQQEVETVDAERAATTRALDQQVRSKELVAERERALREENQELTKKLSEQAERLTRLADELKAFSFTVSHDLRAPVRQVNAFVGMLRESSGASLGEDGARQLDTIERASLRMASMIDDLLGFHAVGWVAMAPAELDLQRLVEDVIDELQPGVLNREIDWSVEGLPRVHADRSLIKQAFVNLLENALKFTKTRERTEISVGHRQEAREHVLFVKDNGVGFDPAYRERLFRIFSRLHSAAEYDGSGIGLAYVKRVVERHGGRVFSESAVDAGATFYLTLPTGEVELKSAPWNEPGTRA